MQKSISSVPLFVLEKREGKKNTYILLSITKRSKGPVDQKTKVVTPSGGRQMRGSDTSLSMFFCVVLSLEGMLIVYILK